MTVHAKAETLSAYLDERLVETEARQLEEHLAQCETCNSRLEGMKSVVASLRRLERLSPPSTLDQMVARRIALAGEQKSFLDRLEDSMAGFQRQSSMLSLFCVVIALVLIVYFFLTAVIERQNATIPVVFESPVSEAPVGTPGDESTGTTTEGQVLQRRGEDWVRVGEEGSLVQMAGKVFERQGTRWVEQGLENQTVDRSIEWDSEAGRDFREEFTELASLQALERPVVLTLGEEVIELR